MVVVVVERQTRRLAAPGIFSCSNVICFFFFSSVRRSTWERVMAEWDVSHRVIRVEQRLFDMLPRASL